MTKTRENKKAVIFDVDGVMLDSEPLFAAGRKKLCAEYGLKEPESKNINGTGMRAFWASVLEFNNNTVLDPSELAHKNFEYVLDGVVENGIAETKGLTPLIIGLKESGYILAVGSSSDRFYVEFVLDHLGVSRYFDFTVCGDEVSRAKPYGDIYLKALDLLKLDARECYVIEDSDNGIKASNAAGIPCIGVSLVTPPTQSFEGCAVKLDSLESVKSFLVN